MGNIHMSIRIFSVLFSMFEIFYNWRKLKSLKVPRVGLKFSKILEEEISKTWRIKDEYNKIF